MSGNAGIKSVNQTADKKCFFVMAIVFMSFAFAGAARAGTWPEQAKFLASDGDADDEFGRSVSISGDYAIVGASSDDSDKGSAYILKWDGASWSEQQKLLASDGAVDDYFGISVSISGDYAIVGADWDDDKGYYSGSAYIFKWNGTSWSQQQKLLASDGTAGDYFGCSVSISGDYAIVGAAGDDSFKGSAYIFKWNGTSWVQQAKKTASDGAADDYFGISVSISGDYAIVGAYGDDIKKGSAYVFKRDGTTWSQQAKLTASDGAADDWFGISVSISGVYAIVGAAGDDSFKGSAYIFKRDGTSWSRQQKLTASDGEDSDGFGFSVSINGDYAIVAATEDNNRNGSAYIFKRDGTNWSEKAKLSASDGAGSDFFGTSVSISGDYAIVGAKGDDDKGEDSGSAYMFACAAPVPASWGREMVVTERQKLLASEGAAGDFFGFSVSISTDYAIVGAEQDDDNGAEAGSAYILKWDGTSFSEQQKLLASDGAASDFFGHSVSISADFAIVGAYGDDNVRGSAYIFKWDGTSWSEQKLTASDGAAGDSFGQSVSISGNFAIVGAYGDDISKGSAYIFKWNGSIWSHLQKLTASDGAADDRFGSSVSISGVYAIVAADGDDDKGSNSGSAYIFKWNGTSWSQQTKLTASDGAADDYFGRSVSISTDFAIIGSDGDDDKGDGSGSAYIFKWNGTSWVQQQKLTASDGAAGDIFARSVSISGDYAIVGAQGDDDKGYDAAGSAYLFKWDGIIWSQQQKFAASDGAASDIFGSAVSISGDYAIVGARADDDKGYNSGSVYAFWSYPRADLDDNRRVDFTDFAFFANWWLYGTD